MKKTILLSILMVANFSISFAQPQFRVLLFTKTDGFHHESIQEGVAALRQLAARHTFAVDWHENASIFNDKGLEKYQCIIFLNTTANILDTEQQGAMERFIKAGKGFVGVHSATDTEYDWPWYNNLIGMMFKIHPAQQTAYLDIITTNFPGMERWPKRLLWTDEWYDFKEILAKDLTYLIKIDEKSYNPSVKWGNTESKGMGDFHPIAWYHKYDGGRAFYTGLGHIGLVYSDPLFLEHLYGGIYWAATGKGL